MAKQRELLRVAGRAVLGLVVLAVLVANLDVESIAGILAQSAWSMIALALAWQALAKFVWAYRWQEVLRASGVERSLVDLVALVLIGLFFNSFLPTAVGGDLVRGYYTSRGPEGRVAGWAAVLIERLLGLATLAAMAGIAAATALAIDRRAFPARALVAVAAVGLVATAACVAAFAWRGWRTSRPARYVAGRFPRLWSGGEHALDLFRRPGVRRARIVAASFALQVVAVLFYVACARAVGLATPAVAFFLIVPASVVVAMLPVSLNGLGLRETTLVGLLVAHGARADRAGAFAILALLISTLFSLLGGLLYPLYRVPAGEIPTEAAR